MRVLLADDHSIVRRGMRSLLETDDSVEVVAEASDGLEALHLCEEHHPDLLILDIAMPQLNGIDVAARSQKMDPPPQAIMLSMYLDESYVMRSINAGARGYLLKDATDEDLLPAIRAVAAGKSFFSPAVSGVLAEEYMAQLQERGLTDSYEVLT
ncbi:MAG TPA: response regulator transcription factor, partial [Thermoanaerobaculia bacterium]